MSPVSCALGGTMVMPFFFSSSMYSMFFAFDSAQPRVSASAPAFSSAACAGLSSASNAALLTSTQFLGSQAWVSVQNLMYS